MTRRYEWWNDLQPRITCGADVLEQVEPAVISGCPVAVHFPILTSADAGAVLAAPAGVAALDGQSITGTENPDEWGILSATGDSGQPLEIWLNRVVVSAEIDTSDPDFESVVRAIDGEADRWLDLARSWVEIVTGQKLTPIGYPARRANTTTLWLAPSETPEGMKFILHAPPTWDASPLVSFKRTQISDYDPAPPATLDIMRSCLELASASTDIPFAWRLIRDARALAFVGQHRRAVIDAGAAAEIAMPILIDNLLPVTLNPKLRKHLTDGTLGRLWEKLIASGYSRQVDVKSDLISVRNAATHQSGTPLTLADSENAINAAAALVEDAFPLPSRMKRLW
ncbi:hypothetical protein [Nocardia sp. NPDC057272]|uniref:hypothetical protein n=1 Tax=Nocardia sp. NPDC057272 TaxID=3346079 RepID=UPI003639C307